MLMRDKRARRASKRDRLTRNDRLVRRIPSLAAPPARRLPVLCSTLDTGNDRGPRVCPPTYCTMAATNQP